MPGGTSTIQGLDASILDIDGAPLKDADGGDLPAGHIIARLLAGAGAKAADADRAWALANQIRAASTVGSIALEQQDYNMVRDVVLGATELAVFIRVVLGPIVKGAIHHDGESQ